LQQLTENKTISWTSLYKHYLEKINSDLPDLIDQTVDNEKSKIDDDDDNNKMIKDDKQEYHAK
ncbi:634_t:CDS:1, partial [Racocetra persica]